MQDLHAKFHVEASDVLDLALKGKKKEAEERMSATGIFAKYSSALTAAMIRWKDA